MLGHAYGLLGSTVTIHTPLSSHTAAAGRGTAGTNLCSVTTLSSSGPPGREQGAESVQCLG